MKISLHITTIPTTHLHPPPTNNTINSMSLISQLLLTQSWQNFKYKVPGNILSDNNYNRVICGTISAYLSAQNDIRSAQPKLVPEKWTLIYIYIYIESVFRAQLLVLRRTNIVLRRTDIVLHKQNLCPKN